MQVHATMGNKSGTPFLWVGPNGVPEGNDLLERSAGEFDLALSYCSYDDLAAKLGSAPWKLVAMDIGGAPEQGLERLKVLRRERPRLCIFAAAGKDSLEMLPLALRSGASDFLSLPLSTTELNKALIRFSQHAEEVAEVEGEVIAIYGARGGLGATTLAITLAAELARISGSDAGLVDLDLFRGDVSACLGLDGGNSITALAGSAEIDQSSLGRALERHASGLAILQAPPAFEQAEAVTRESVVRALQLFKARCRFTVVDTARLLTEVSIAALQEADRVILLTDLSIPGVRAAQRVIDLLARYDLDPERIEVVMTELEKSGIKIEEVSKALGKKSIPMLPRDPNVGAATNAGNLIANSRNSALGAMVAGMARALSGDAARPNGPPLLKRLFGLGRS